MEITTEIAYLLSWDKEANPLNFERDAKTDKGVGKKQKSDLLNFERIVPAVAAGPAPTYFFAISTRRSYVWLINLITHA